jgi:hypothetical protein
MRRGTAVFKATLVTLLTAMLLHWSLATGHWSSRPLEQTHGNGLVARPGDGHVTGSAGGNVLDSDKVSGFVTGLVALAVLVTKHVATALSFVPTMDSMLVPVTAC